MAKSVHPVFPSVLRDKTRILISKADRKLTYVVIAKATGLSEQWIGQFANGRLKAPDVGRVETLYNYLSDTPLKV